MYMFTTGFVCVYVYIYIHTHIFTYIRVCRHSGRHQQASGEKRCHGVWGSPHDEPPFCLFRIVGCEFDGCTEQWYRVISVGGAPRGRRQESRCRCLGMVRHSPPVFITRSNVVMCSCMWSYGHMVMCSCAHVVIWSCAHVLMHVVIWSYGHVLVCSCSHMVMCSCGHVVMWSCGHHTM